MNALARSKCPSVDQCYRLLKGYNVPDHIIQHSEMVCKIASFLADELNNQGENLSTPEIEAAALLHDMTKMEGLKTSQDHAKTGKRLLLRLGFKRIGEIVAGHIRLQEVQNPKPLTEEEIINYSDKRVMHTRVVPLAERFADLRKRYADKGLGKNVIERMIALEHKTYELEKKIFSKLDFTPEELPHLTEEVSKV
jgi:putative nucleotidyltransferase with HDIG domain